MAIITGNEEDALCPELATPTFIITKENVDSLKLSTYERTHGTTVVVTCLAAPHYNLVGSNLLTCLNSSQWDKAMPKCQPADSTAGVSFDISMVPVLVGAASVGVLLLALVCIMVFVLCCWKTATSPSQGKPKRGTPIGLFRSLSLQEAESVFNQRRHRYCEASDYSDVIDSVSAHGASRPLSHSPELEARQALPDITARSSPTTYVTAISRGTESPLRTRASFPRFGVYPSPITDTISRSSPTTYITATSRGTQPPPLQIGVVSGRPYRTWHELFYT